MVNEKLRAEMNKAYADGDKKKALSLSRKLDRQILNEYKSKYTPKKDTKKSPSIEI